MRTYDNKQVIGETFLSLLDKKLFVDIPVFGLSMFPFYLPADIVRVENSNNSNLEVGNVVVFLRNERLVAHRLIKVDFDSGLALTKGDGLIKKDGILKIKDIRGVVVTHFRKGVDVGFVNRPFFKRLLVYLSPLMGYVNFPLSRLWYKIFYR